MMHSMVYRIGAAALRQSTLRSSHSFCKGRSAADENSIDNAVTDSLFGLYNTEASRRGHGEASMRSRFRE